MLQRHETELMLRLEKVHTFGVSVIYKDELLRWYGQERISAKVWRDVASRFNETLPDSKIGKTTLLVGDANGAWSLAWSEGLKTTSESWFKDIAVLGGREADAITLDQSDNTSKDATK